MGKNSRAAELVAGGVVGAMVGACLGATIAFALGAAFGEPPKADEVSRGFRMIGRFVVLLSGAMAGGPVGAFAGVKYVAWSHRVEGQAAEPVFDDDEPAT